MEDLAKYEGYCCLWACLMANKRARSGAFAKHYGVSRQTIIYFRKKLKRGQMACAGKPKPFDGESGCLKTIVLAPE